MADYDKIPKTLTVALSGTTSSSGALEYYTDFVLHIPTLDTTSFKVQLAASPDAPFADVVDADGVQQLVWANTATPKNGDVTLDSNALARIRGAYAIRVVLGSGQNTGARSLTLTCSTPGNV